MAVVEVSFSALPAHVRTARLIASAVGRRSGLMDGVLDEIRLAVGEACLRAVELNRRHAPDQPVILRLSDDGEDFTVVVVDRAPTTQDTSRGPGAKDLGRADLDFEAFTRTAGTLAPGPVGPVGAPLATVEAGPVATAAPGATVVDDPVELPQGVGLAIIAGLVDDVTVSAGQGREGTEVCMSWPLAESRIGA